MLKFFRDSTLQLLNFYGCLQSEPVERSFFFSDCSALDPQPSALLARFLSHKQVCSRLRTFITCCSLCLESFSLDHFIADSSIQDSSESSFFRKTLHKHIIANNLNQMPIEVQSLSQLVCAFLTIPMQ